MISDELVNENNLIIDGRRKRVGFGKEVILWIFLDGADEGTLLLQA